MLGKENCCPYNLSYFTALLFIVVLLQVVHKLNNLNVFNKHAIRNSFIISKYKNASFDYDSVPDSKCKNLLLTRLLTNPIVFCWNFNNAEILKN